MINEHEGAPSGKEITGFYPHSELKALALYLL